MSHPAPRTALRPRSLALALSAAFAAVLLGACKQPEPAPPPEPAPAASAETTPPADTAPPATDIAPAADIPPPAETPPSDAPPAEPPAHQDKGKTESPPKP